MKYNLRNGTASYKRKRRAVLHYWHKGYGIHAIVTHAHVTPPTIKRILKEAGESYE